MKIIQNGQRPINVYSSDKQNKVTLCYFTTFNKKNT